MSDIVLGQHVNRLIGQHSGVGILVGNGKSREHIDLETLRTETEFTFIGCNILYKTFVPDYTAIMNYHILVEIAKDAPNTKIIYRAIIPQGHPSTLFTLKTYHFRPKFMPFAWMNSGYLSAYVMSKIMGFSKIVLLGMDMSTENLFYKQHPQYVDLGPGKEITDQRKKYFNDLMLSSGCEWLQVANTWAVCKTITLEEMKML